MEVLKGVSLTAQKGDVVAIIGGSGSGKSTCLRCINFLETPSAGQIIVNGEEIKMRQDGSPVDRRQIERIRTRLGMVFQAFNLWTHRTLLENVIEVPVHVLKVPRDEAIKRLGRYQREAGMQHSGVGSIKEEKLLAYADVVHYDLEALAQHLEHEGTERPMLVIIMGDHQPPFLAKRMGFGVPVHVLSTDPVLLAEFEARGFIPGMVPPQRNRPEMQHQSCLLYTSDAADE